ncbi:MAG: YceI family protein [Proteobacteria bacterium]|nr:YceI family protein [Pseudomonadota bacterium]
MNRILWAAVAAMTLLLPSPCQARSWSIDDNHTQAAFSIRHVAGKVLGFFNKFEGTIVDPDMPGHGMIDVRIAVDSINTGVEQRDAHLKTADFFDSADNPQIHFTSAKIMAKGDGWFEAHGVLTIRGINRSMVLPFTLTEIKKYPPVPGMECMDVLGFQAHATLNRLDFEVGDGKFYKLGIVDDTVGITLYGELLSPRPDCH